MISDRYSIQAQHVVTDMKVPVLLLVPLEPLSLDFTNYSSVSTLPYLVLHNMLLHNREYLVQHKSNNIIGGTRGL